VCVCVCVFVSVCLCLYVSVVAQLLSHISLLEEPYRSLVSSR
jgi:hypothetical protein